MWLHLLLCYCCVRIPIGMFVLVVVFCCVVCILYCCGGKHILYNEGMLLCITAVWLCGVNKSVAKMGWCVGAKC